MKFFCITGPDGSGKSTLCSALVHKFDNHGMKAKEVSIWDILFDEKAQRLMPFKTKEEIGFYLSYLKPKARTLFMFHALTQAFEVAADENNDVLILNSYWYKYYISELLYGSDKKLLDGIVLSFVQPDLTLFLDLKPQEALTRKKGELSQYESSSTEGLQQKNEFFLKFQEKSYSMWKSFQNEKKWLVLDACNSKEELLNKAWKVIHGQI